jgi:hypothetical protein
VGVERDSGMSGRMPREKEAQAPSRSKEVQPTAPKKAPAFTALVDFSSVRAAAIHDGRATFSRRPVDGGIFFHPSSHSYVWTNEKLRDMV